MTLKNFFLFIPDLDSKSGLGHYFRCLKFLEFFKKKYRTYILIKKNKTSVNLLSKTKYNKIIFFNNLESIIKRFSNKENFFFIDSYDKKKIDLINHLTKNTISTADNLVKLNTKYIVDHTFLRNKKDHERKNPDSIIYSNYLFFPFNNKKEKKIKKYIMINFGTYNSKKDILSVLSFITRNKLNLKYKILIIDKKFKLNLLNKDNLKNIDLIHYTNNLNKYYSKTFFCFGACGISLYERSFYGIPSICKPIAKNQIYNYKNFLKKKCIIDFSSIIEDKEFTFRDFTDILKKTKKNLNFYFSPKKQMKQMNKLIKNIK